MGSPTTDSAQARPDRLLWLAPASVAVAAWLMGLIWPHLLVRLGIHDYGTRFLDSYAVLAALDAVRAGADPLAANPLDPLLRFHVYSDWWLGLRWLGLTRAHNDWVGAACVVTFVITFCLTLRPRRWGEAIWLAVLLVSPAVALVLNRANNDLIIFVLLSGCGVAAAAGGWRLLLAIALLVLATGLKYYPVVAAVPFLWVRPARTMPWVLAGALVAALLTLASVWPQIDRGRFMIGPGIYTMGAPIWWRDLGWTDASSALSGLVLLLVMACGLTRARITTGLAVGGEPRERLLAAIGATVVLACFLAGVNYAYRWIFVLGPAWWLWRRAGDVRLDGRERGVAALGVILVALALWSDGIFCAAINALPPRSADWVNQVQLTYRLWTQPLQWLLMGLLAGWLLEAALDNAREWWRQRRGQPAA